MGTRSSDKCEDMDQNLNPTDKRMKIINEDDEYKILPEFDTLPSLRT